MNKEIPTYRVITAEDDSKSTVFAISTVHNPAIAKLFVAFSDDEGSSTFNTCLASEDKMRLTGPVLIPNIPILRHMPELNIGNEGYFNMLFDEQGIENLANKFARHGNTFNITSGHEDVVDCAFVFESWLVTDPNNDKSSAMGFKDIQAGTWFVTMQVTDPQWWAENIKTNKFRGFSVEMAGVIDITTALAVDKVSFDYDGTLSTDAGKEIAKEKIAKGIEVYIISARDNAESMYATADELGIPHENVYATGSNEAKIAKIKELNVNRHYDNNQDVIDAIGPIGHKLEKLQTNMTYTLADGSTVEISDLAVDGTITDETGAPLDGSFTLEDGTVIEATAGVITAVTLPVDAAEVAPVEDTVDPTEDTVDVNVLIADALAPLIARIEALEGANTNMQAENIRLSELVTKLSNEPAPSTIEKDVKPSKSHFKTSMERIAAMKANLANNK